MEKEYNELVARFLSDNWLEWVNYAQASGYNPDAVYEHLVGEKEE